MADDNNAVIEGLRKVFADTYVVYAKTHSFHWNVTGPRFKSLHDLFMEQYTEMWQALDVLAERIRQLDADAPHAHTAFSEGASIAAENGVPDAETMLERLVEAHDKLQKTLKDAIEKADDADDEGTEDMLIARLQVSQEQQWMLKASR